MNNQRGRKVHQKNSTIRQQQQNNHHNGNQLENDSSIQLRQHNDGDVHYYDLDYSDQHNQQNQGIVSSSDEQGRQITHQEFMSMISTNQLKQQKEQKYEKQQYQHNNDYQGEEEQQYEEDSSDQHQRNYHHARKQHHNYRSNDFKLHYNKRVTPSTRDKSHNFYQYGQKIHQIHEKQDPEKSSQNKGSSHQNNRSNQCYKSTQNKGNLKLDKTSFNQSNLVNQFKIDSFINTKYPKKTKDQSKAYQSKAWKQFNGLKKEKQDQEFSLITLPEYQEQCSSISEKRLKHNMNKNNELKRNINAKYENVMSEQQQSFQGLKWRYDQVKLRFIDNFMPTQLKIRNNPYNLLKYINTKHQLNYKILNIN